MNGLKCEKKIALFITPPLDELCNYVTENNSCKIRVKKLLNLLKNGLPLKNLIVPLH